MKRTEIETKYGTVIAGFTTTGKVVLFLVGITRWGELTYTAL